LLCQRSAILRITQVSRTFEVTKHGDPTSYHYIFSAESKERGWLLQRAWHTGPDGRLIKELGWKN